jgi:hypothetical protein
MRLFMRSGFIVGFRSKGGVFNHKNLKTGFCGGFQTSSRCRARLKAEETMNRHALPASATAVPNHRHQSEGTIARYGIETEKSKNH